MEIRELNLAAFGPFTERTLLFDPAGGGGLQIVYGPNEAGKSSALRGLKALLYGFDERSADDFIHAKDKLRVAGRVCASNGNELVFARRKGRKNTLLSPEGQPLDENALSSFLQGVGPELFETLFGIDHQALVQGGREILDQQGEVGQALFSASLGSHSLHAVLCRLDEEADGLFRPRGLTQTINSALKSYSDLKKEIKDRSLSSREWDELHGTLTRTSTDLENVQTDLDSGRIELNRLKRIQRVLPRLARRGELREQIEKLGPVRVLQNDFGERRHKIVTELQTGQIIHKKATAHRESLQAQLEGYSVRQEVLEHSNWIENLQERLGSHRKAMLDRPQIKAECQQLLRDVASLLKELRPDLGMADIELLRSVLAKKPRISELGKQHAALLERVTAAEKRVRETRAQLLEARNESDKNAGAASIEPLRQAIVAARKFGDLDGVIRADRREFTKLNQQCESELARLTLWTGSLAQISGLPVPNRETIKLFDDRYSELDKALQRLRDRHNENAKALREAMKSLEEITLTGAIPSEGELSQARTQREVVWHLVRRQWIDGEDVTYEAHAIDAQRSLPDAFEHLVARADEIADRLRREGDRVHARAALLAEAANAKRRAAEIAQQIDECSATKQKVDREWEALWYPCEIRPSTPREMRAWLDNLETLRGRVEQSNGIRIKLDDLENVRGAQIQSIKQRLQLLGKECPNSDSMDVLLLHGEAILEGLQKSHRESEILEKEIKTLERTLESAKMEYQCANQELLVWKERWTQAIASFGFDADATPSEADAVIDQLQQLFWKQAEAGKLQIRIQEMDQDTESFFNEAGRAVASIAPELADQEIDVAVPGLNTLLSENRSRQSKREQIEEQFQQANQEIQNSELQIQSMLEKLKALCDEARCENSDALDEAERGSTEFLRLRQEAERLEQEIVNTGEGASLKELETEAATADPNAQPGQIDTLNRRIEELEPKRTELAEAKGAAAQKLKSMAGGAEAAALADQAQSVLASIRSNAQHYLRLKLAGKILSDQIERYRKENQGPLLKRASEHFAGLTRGSFAGLRTDINEKDEPVLVGIRPDQQRVHVEGMSSGTRDQLYLALRLASLEKYMESAAPLPFIVDDILVDFDDERTESALNALASLAEKTQVILFTHHSRVVEQARKLRTSAPVRVHDL